MSVTETAPGVRYCGALTLEGGTCRQIVGLDVESGLCVFHDPARSEEATAARHRGAAATHAREPEPTDVPPPPDPKVLADVIGWHSWITGALSRGQIGKSVATGLAYNLQQLRAALVSRDLEREVAELRATVALLRRQRQGAT